MLVLYGTVHTSPQPSWDIYWNSQAWVSIYPVLHQSMTFIHFFFHNLELSCVDATSPLLQKEKKICEPYYSVSSPPQLI